ncbi:hypothetical protein LCGC14_2845960, partial [marine sediment metagenome]
MTDPVEWSSEVVEPLANSSTVHINQIQNGFMVAANTFSDSSGVYCATMPQCFTLLTAWRERRRAI